MENSCAFRFSKYNYFKNLIMRIITRKKGEKIDASKDYDYTNWDQVKRFLLEFIKIQKSN